MIVANVIGFTLHAMLMVTTRLGIDRWVRGRGQVATAAYYTVIITFGVVVGFSIVALASDPQALNMNAVESTRRDLGGRVFVKLKAAATELAASRAYAQKFKQM